MPALLTSSTPSYHLAHHLCAHESALEGILTGAGRFYRVNLCPLGAAAFASTGFNLNRKDSGLLGFEA
jgi:argininosuccinate lyase